MLQLLYSATVVEMTPVAQTNIEFYEIVHFLSKTTSFYKKLPPFYKKTTDGLPKKKLKPLISPFIKKTKFLEIIETPDHLRRPQKQASKELLTCRPSPSACACAVTSFTSRLNHFCHLRFCLCFLLLFLVEAKSGEVEEAN